MIKIRGLTKIFRSKKGDVIALNELDLDIPENKFVLIKGASGCGKSTLLFSLGGMLMPSSGAVEIFGKDVYQLSEKERATFRSDNLGFVFQSYYLIPYLNVLENILFSKNAGFDGITPDMAIQFAKKLNLEDRLNHNPSELSIGEKQRVALARALITHPQLILADEPTGNLDPENTKEVLNHLEKFHQSGGSVVMVTHGNEADKLADLIIYMEKGKISNFGKK